MAVFRHLISSISCRQIQEVLVRCHNLELQVEREGYNGLTRFTHTIEIGGFLRYFGGNI